LTGCRQRLRRLRIETNKERTLKTHSILRTMGAGLAVCGLIAAFGCGGDKGGDTSGETKPAASAVQQRLNDPNIPPDIKAKIQQSSQAGGTGGTAAPTSGGR
jgi:hypothetical protein